MIRSKIAAISTYHRCMKQLIGYGYFKYEPTYDTYKGTKVTFTPIFRVPNIKVHMEKAQTERQNSNKGSKPGNKSKQHLDSDKTFSFKTVSESKNGEKIYTVIVTYVEISEEKMKIKRSIVEAILKKSYFSKGPDNL